MPGLFIINEAFRIFSSEFTPSSNSISFKISSSLKVDFIIPLSLTKTSNPFCFASKAAPTPLSPAPSMTILFFIQFFNWDQQLKKMVLQQYEFKGLGKLHRHWNCLSFLKQ